MTTPSEETRPPSQPLPDQRAAEVGVSLAAASQQFLAAVGNIRSAVDLMKAIGVKKDVASRFLTALSKRDPLAIIYYMPGVDSLRQLTHGARARIGEHPAISAFEEAVGNFERFVQIDMGGRHALDAMASAWLPEARERFEVASRQMIYRGMANLHGVECEIDLSTAILHPSQAADRADAIRLSGIIGLRRLRPTVPLVIAAVEHHGTVKVPWETIDGKTIEDTEHLADLLPAFSEFDTHALRTVRAGTTVRYELVDTALGLAKTSDLFLGQFVPSAMPMYHQDPEPHVYLYGNYLDFPAKRLVLDLLIHKDVWPESEPSLYFFNTTVRGILRYPKETLLRPFDQMHLLDTVRRIGTGVECCRIAEVPRYIELLQWACGQRGWNPADFRVYRCDSRYPPIGVQHLITVPVLYKPH